MKRINASHCGLPLMSVDSSTCKANSRVFWSLVCTLSSILTDKSTIRLWIVLFDKGILRISCSVVSPRIVLTIFLQAGKMIDSAKACDFVCSAVILAISMEATCAFSEKVFEKVFFVWLLLWQSLKIVQIFILKMSGFPHNFQKQIPWHSMTFPWLFPWLFLTFVTLFPCVFKWYLHLQTSNSLIKNDWCCANGIQLCQTCSLCSSCVASQNQTNIAINTNQ